MKKDFKEFIKESMLMLRSEMGLSDIMINLTFATADKMSKNYSDSQVAMVCNYYRIYKEAEITIYPTLEDQYNKGMYQRIYQGIVHELTHLHTWHLAELARERYVTDKQIEEAEEILTESVSRIIAKVHQDKFNKIITNLDVKSSADKKAKKK